MPVHEVEFGRVYHRWCGGSKAASPCHPGPERKESCGVWSPSLACGSPGSVLPQIRACDAEEIGRGKASAADQGAIHVGDRQQLPRVRRLHRAAVEDADFGLIRNGLKGLVGEAHQTKVRILYGGSVKPSNARELLSVANVDGALEAV